MRTTTRKTSRMNTDSVPDHKRLAYSIADVSTVTGIGRSSIFKAIKDGSLRSVLRCGRRLVLHEDLLAFLRGESDAA